MLFSAPKSKHLPIGREAQQSPSVFKKGVPILQVRTHKHLLRSSIPTGGGGGGGHIVPPPPGTLPQISQERLELRT